MCADAQGKRIALSNFVLIPMKSYSLQPERSTEIAPAAQRAGLEIAYDVGHSSIGWAALRVPGPGEAGELLGCGSVTFPADDCLASKRRDFRRQRRHIRATRQRIARIERLLVEIDVFSAEELARKHTQGGGHAAPWFLAARVINDGPLLTWPELWDVIRWYAHNRGYDGNRSWAREDTEAQQDDTKKLETARHLLAHYKKETMCEMFCAISGLDPLGTKISCNLPGNKRPKAQNAAFPRDVVEREVRQILERHAGRLPKLDAEFVSALMTDWRGIPCDAIRLPLRYQGGLLFGQLVPRFENRIIATCPITFEREYGHAKESGLSDRDARDEATKRAKVPNKNSPEFLRFRWAMQVANVFVTDTGDEPPRALSIIERQSLDAAMQERGYMSAKEFRATVREITGCVADNLDQLLTHPDAEKALVLDPVRKALDRGAWKTLFPALPEHLRIRAERRIRKGRKLSLADLIGENDFPAFENALAGYLAAQNTKRAKNQTPLSREEVLSTKIEQESLSGRAPYARPVLIETADFVFSTNRHPTEGAPDPNAFDNGPLYRSETIRKAQLQREIDEQTNNHLVRHRLKILERLHRDVIAEFAAGDPNAVTRITIEVNRELRELSGKPAKEVAQELGQRLANFNSVHRKLEDAFAGRGIRITPGLIRKARIAEDLGWKCPYTGQSYDPFDLLDRKVDKDHIVPRADRQSDSLDSLVITFSEVNRMKGRLTAIQFVEKFGGDQVDGLPQLTIKTPDNFRRDVEALEAFKGHNDDKKRKRNRKRLLLVRDYVEKEFVPRDLTQTSQLVRLGAQTLERLHDGQQSKPRIVSQPGSVTGTVRKSWNVLGCLVPANPQVLNPDELDENGKPRPHIKSEIRKITHLHHALDACVLVLTSHLIPSDGAIWKLLIKRRFSDAEKKLLQTRMPGLVQFSGDSQLRLSLPGRFRDQVTRRLCERRVVQHIPAEMTGMPTDETIYRLLDPTDKSKQSKRLQSWLERLIHSGAERRIDHLPDPTDPNETLAVITARKRRVDKQKGTGKTLHDTGHEWRWIYAVVSKESIRGFSPTGAKHGKLKALKSVKLLGENFGVAWIVPKDGMPVFEIIRPHKVWHRLSKLKAGYPRSRITLLRRGTLIALTEKDQSVSILRICGCGARPGRGIYFDTAPADVITRQREVKVSAFSLGRVRVLQTSYTGVADCG